MRWKVPLALFDKHLLQVLETAAKVRWLAHSESQARFLPALFPA